MAEIGLADVVSALRAELEKATDSVAEHRVRFRATSVDLEFQVGITKTAEGKAGVRFRVLELGGGGSYKSESIQTVRISLDPIDASGGQVEIAEGSDVTPLAVPKGQRE